MMACVIGGVIASLLAALLYLRWRADHPLAGPDSVRSITGGDDGELSPDSTEASPPGDPWQRSPDWWKSGEP